MKFCNQMYLRCNKKKKKNKTTARKSYDNFTVYDALSSNSRKLNQNFAKEKKCL